MSNTVSTAWVKNVYSLRINSGIDRGETSFLYTPPTLARPTMWVQAPVFTQLVAMFSAVLPTRKIAQLPLLINGLYTVSTIPTIRSTKEIKERNS